MKKLILSIALAGTILLTSGSTIFAGNHIDTKFDFYFTSPNKVRTTEARPKLDATSSYVKINAGKNLNLGVSMKMVGEKWNGSHYEDVGSSTKTFYRPGSAKIPQNTYEWGKRGTRLQGIRVNPGYMTVFGLWSPDSI
ncbi:hypothetical protein [Peptostreptococcus stomatis]|uniref:hypothetical protein n=1 Tax=Peptostreptococcus stomatis TaxID=341694 RepID=UPI003FA1004F